jgi:hypothetical protein
MPGAIDPALTNGSPAARATAQALIAKLKEGGFQPNPARSLMVGVIGLWRKGEPPHEPGDRALIQQGNSQVASAHIRLDPATMTLDLSNSVPEVDKDLTKMDLGPLTVVAISPASQAVTTLGTFDYSQYDRAAYEARAFIVTVPLAAGAAQIAADGNLEMRDAKGNTARRAAAARHSGDAQPVPRRGRARDGDVPSLQSRSAQRSGCRPITYGLARDAERAHCLAHRQEVLAGITVEAILEVLGEADTPRGAGCRLLAGNNAVIEQAMDGRWGDAKHNSDLLDRQ